jgi:hypothetical protein
VFSVRHLANQLNDDSPEADKLYASDLTTVNRGGIRAAQQLYSFEIGFVPGLNAVQGLHQAVTGCDAFTGQTLNPLQRGLGVLAAAGPLLHGAAAIVGGGGEILGDFARSEGRFVRGTTDIDALKPYIWTAPNGRRFDVLLDHALENGSLVIRDAHIQPVDYSLSGRVQEAARGLRGIRDLGRAMGDYFNVDSIELTNEIGKVRKGRSFGPGVYRVR